MAKKELPKAQLGAIVKMAKGAYQGMKTGYKTYKAASLAEKAAKLKKAQAAARTQKAAATRAANAKAANAAKNSKTATPKTATPKGKEPFVKSKYRQKLENASGEAVGALTYGTGNVVKKVLKNRIAQSIIGGGATAYVMNKIAEGRRPVKIKKIKKK